MNSDILVETGTTVNNIIKFSSLIAEEIDFKANQIGEMNFCLRRILNRHRNAGTIAGNELSICCENASVKLKNLAQENIYTMMNEVQRQSTSAIKWTLNEIAHTNPVTRLNSVFNYLQSIYDHSSSWNNGDGKDLLYEQSQRLQYNALVLYQDFIQCSVDVYNNFTSNAVGIVLALQSC